MLPSNIENNMLTVPSVPRLPNPSILAQENEELKVKSKFTIIRKLDPNTCQLMLYLEGALATV